jgi:excisionase family DNA binding protein
MINPDENYLTIAEIAAHLRTSKMTIYRLVRAGKIDAIRIGRSFRVPAASLDNYIKSIPVTESTAHDH